MTFTMTQLLYINRVDRNTILKFMFTKDTKIRWNLPVDLNFTKSWHQTTNSPILFFPIFSPIFSQFEQLNRENFLLVQNRVFLTFGTNEKFVFFFNYEKFVENIGETKLVVWWFDFSYVKATGRFRHIFVTSLEYLNFSNLYLCKPFIAGFISNME